MAKIALDKVSFTYPSADKATLANLSLQIAQGESHALLGASGAGKTTLLNVLSGLLQPSSGQIFFDDIEVSQLSGRQRQVAQVFQFPVLYESLNVADNLAFPLRVQKLTKSKVNARVDYICGELGLDAVRQAKPKSLSLFEKQLVAVGKALVRPDVSLVLLDEPLTAVEPKIKWRLRQTLRKVQAEFGVTMIYVTHDQTEALTFADRVSVLTADGIVQTDTPQAVYQSPAHEFVGHFVGSPGMNFVPADVLSIPGAQRVGFRSEWASLVTRAPLMGVIKRQRVQGTRKGKVYGLVTVQTAFGQIYVRGDLADGGADAALGTAVGVQVDRYVAFANQQKVAESDRL